MSGLEVNKKKLVGLDDTMNYTHNIDDREKELQKILVSIKHEHATGEVRITFSQGGLVNLFYNKKII